MLASSPQPGSTQLLDRVHRAYEQSQSLQAQETWTLRVGPHLVQVQCKHPTIGASLRRAMGHLETQESSPEKLTLFLFEESPEHPVGWAEQTRELLVRGDVRHEWGEEFELSANRASGLVQLLHAPSRTAAAWLPPQGQLEAWELAAPLRNLWSLLARHSEPPAALLHAAAIDYGGRALLLTGPGGSGKSTTSLAALHQGARFLGDDFVWCSLASTHPMSSRPAVASLYRTAKLLPSSLTHTLLTSESTSGQDGEKSVLCLSDSNQLLSSSSAVAWVVPQKPTTLSQASLSPLRPIELLRALLPSSLFLVAGATRARHHILRELAQTLPAYALHLSPRLDENSALLRQLAESAPLIPCN